MTDQILDLVAKEKERQETTLMMIPSENYTYPEVREVVGSVLMHKYAEGYPGKRYYQGMEFVDQIENIAIDRVKSLFGVAHANVQPYSGSPANTAVYFALLSPGDTLMGLSLAAGGHLTHGHSVSLSGKYFKSVQYVLDDKKEKYFDFEEIRRLALENKPKIIVVGTTAFPRTLPWEEFAKIAEEVDAYLMADISHIAGLVAGGAHPSPVPHVHIVTTTTHKTLRGPRGALIMVTDKGIQKDSNLGSKIDKAVFPGLQGGPHLHTIAGIAITAEKASQLEFKEYAQQVVKNAQALSQSLIANGFNLVTGGTDNHLLLVDLQNVKIDGKTAAEKLEAEGIVVNKNSIPNDPNPPARPSGIRLGTPGITTRGMKEPEMKHIGEMIKKVLIDNVSVKDEVFALCQKFPVNF
ncbi:MAG: serine hydroxymethyltransferase [Patescibacteria group bacterium]|jgi:glycine hydroxymethyltransferase